MKYEKLPFERIRNLRVDMNLSQAEVARVLSVKQNAYSQYETDALRSPIEAVICLAEFYGTSADYPLGPTDDPAPYERKGRRRAPLP